MWQTLKYGLRGLLASFVFIPAITFIVWPLYGVLVEKRTSPPAVFYVLFLISIFLIIPVYKECRKVIREKYVRPFIVGFTPLSLLACWYAFLLLYVPTSLLDAPTWGKNFGEDEVSCKLLPHSQSDLGKAKTTSGIVAGLEYSDKWDVGLKIFYTYIVDGKEYKSATIKPKSLLKAKDIAEQYPKGSSIEVHYNPENPQMSYVSENPLQGIHDRCTASYEWGDSFLLPDNLAKDKQAQLADCIMGKLNLPEFKKEIHATFPEFSDERIQGIGIGPVDGSIVMDYYKNRIEIWITIPSSLDEYQKRHPALDFINSRLNQEMKACIQTGY